MRKISIRISAILLCFFALAQTAGATKLLVPGGQIIGLELQTDAVTVVAFDDALGKAAKNAGLQVGDRILKINDVEFSCERPLATPNPTFLFVELATSL